MTKEKEQPIRCGLCNIDLSHMTPQEFDAHMQSKKHVEAWMDYKLKKIIKKGKERKS